MLICLFDLNLQFRVLLFCLLGFADVSASCDFVSIKVFWIIHQKKKKNNFQLISNKLLAFWQLTNNSLVSHVLMWIIICAISNLVIGNIPHLLSSSTRIYLIPIHNLNQCQSAHCCTNSSALRHCSTYTTLLQAIIMTLVLLYWAPAPYSNRSLASQQLNSRSFMTLESLEHYALAIGH